MTEFLIEYGLFLAKTLTVVVAVVVVTVAVVGLSKRDKTPEKLTVKNLNNRLDELRKIFQSKVLPAKEWKKLSKKLKADKKQKEKKRQGSDSSRIFVLNFHGDIKASAVSSLREEVTSILMLAGENDSVLLKLENTGGIVHEHGLGASQVKRLRDAGIHVTVAVDKVAASGGYMMACVANRIICAPFAVIGSIGVLAQLPNFNETLKRHGIKFEQATAGQYKRTVTMFGENTDEHRAKLREQVDQIHTLFKQFIVEHRPSLDLERVATGEVWYGVDALEIGLVDEIKTSDDFLLERSGEADLYEISYAAKKTLSEKLMAGMNAVFAHGMDMFKYLQPQAGGKK